MKSREIVPANPDYDYSDGQLSRAASVCVPEGRQVDAAQVMQLRNGVTDKDCGDYRQCWTRASNEPGCGARISVNNRGKLVAQCPAGTASPYIGCAQRVITAIAREI